MSIEEVLLQFEPMVKKQMATLQIYKNQEDFFQIGLIGLWEAYNRYNPEKGAFPAFAQVTVRGKMLTHLRKEMHAAEDLTVLSDEMLEVIADPNEQYLLEREEVLSYCQGLTEKQLKWVMLGILENKKPQEIAEIEAVSVENVKGWRKSALKKIFKNYEQLQLHI